jgi:hypothetical protein
MVKRIEAEENSMKILKQRYAKGDITKKQYLVMKEDLIEDKEKETKTVKSDSRAKAKSKPKTGNRSLAVVGAAIVVIVIIVLAFATLGHSSNNSSTGGSNGVVISSVGSTIPFAPTPKEVSVSGSVATTGSGTSISQLVFTNSSGTTFPATVSGGEYTVTLPNPSTYSISEVWTGSYSWQRGVSQNVATLNLNQGSGASSSVQYSLAQLSTPPSVVSLTGSATASGTGTLISQLVFVGSSGSYQADLSGGQYSINLPNGEGYSIDEAWASGYSWQGGIVSGSGTLNLNQTAGSSGSMQYTIPQLSTPDAVINVYGSAQTGTGTTPVGVNFTSSSGQDYIVSVSGGSSYTTELPNLQSYTVKLIYRDAFGGTAECPATTSLSLFEGVGVSAVSENYVSQSGCFG